MAGANRSARVMPPRILPLVRAARPALDEAAAHLGDPEGETRLGAPASAFDLLDLRAQSLYGGLEPQAAC